MPELPEVQTTADYLHNHVVGRKIVGVWYDWPKLKSVEGVRDGTIVKVRRVGKNILFYLDNDKILLVHQKMTGHLLVGTWKIDGKAVLPLAPPALKERVNDFIHCLITLDDGQMVGLSDMRKFGTMVVGATDVIENSKELRQLGPDALEVDFATLSRRLQSRRKTVYQTIMDQTVIAGIGNIYASDILFAARVHPLTSAEKLNQKELKAIWEHSKKILQLALKLKGTSIADYRTPSGESGSYGRKRLVYQREGERCPRRCGGLIKRLKQGGRSVFFCPHCQKQ